MITREEAEQLRAQLLTVLAEDAHNTERLLARLASITEETGIGAHAALLLILTRQRFDEELARGHWETILAHRQHLSHALGRDTGIRVAVLDYFMNVNRHEVEPTWIDLEMREADPQDAVVDPLTGLATDRRFRAAVQNELRRAKRYALEAAVVRIDVDNFARINTRCGPLVADRLLRELAIVLHNNIRDIDLAGRLGEDEMALLLPETGPNGALLVAERFRRETETFFAQRESAGAPVELTVSAGVACYPQHATDAEAVLEDAAQALYQAKAAGKNTVQVYHPERRRFLRFELAPMRCEIEVLSPPDHRPGHARNLSQSGILFSSPEPLLVGEHIEIRFVADGSPELPPLRIRGCVVRLEQLPDADGLSPAADRYEVGVAFDLEWGEGTSDLLRFLEQVQGQRMDRQR